MPDITKTELLAAMPDGALKTWWTATEDLPTGIEMTELFLNSIKYAFDAQATKNAGLAAGSRVAAYEFPAGSAPSIDATTRVQTFIQTATIRARVLTSLDNAVGVSA